MEVWKDVIGYEGLYQVSNTGRVRSFKRKNPIILKQGILRGYARVTLVKDYKNKTWTVHRLVALAFIPNPENKPQINHKDENKLNNNVENLDWVTSKENINWGISLKKRSLHQRITQKSKAVYQYDRSLNLINEFSSCHEAARITCFDRSGISHSCHKKRGFATYKGYIWSYVKLKKEVSA